MADNSIGLYMEHIFYEHWMKNTIFFLKFFRPFLDSAPQLFFRRTQYVWFLLYLYVDLVPNSSGQLAELIVYIIPLQ